jgi:pectate lyase C
MTRKHLLRLPAAAMILAGMVFSSTVHAQEGGSAKWSKDSKGTITVSSGTFDGQGKEFGKIGDGSQKESQPAVFELEPGTSLRNVKIVPPAGDGIHVQGDNRVSNVTFTDVGEDAISMRSSAKGGIVIIENCSFSNGDDKIFQSNHESTWYIKDCKINGAGKVFRQNGGTTFKLTVFIENLNASNFGEAVVRSDASACTVYYKDCPSKWVGKLKAVQWDGNNPKPPTLSDSKTQIIVPELSFSASNNDRKTNINNAAKYDMSGRIIIQSPRSQPSMIYLMNLQGDNHGKVLLNSLK